MTPAEIRALRQRLGLSQVAFAARLGVGWATVQRWETGKVAPSNLGYSALARLAREVARAGNRVT